jgi:predicted ATPase
MLTVLAVAGYRSLRDVVLPLGPLNLITGPNGSGKSSVYRALRLLSDAAQGRLASSLAAEGGLRSTLWAGPEKFSRAMRAGEVPVQGTKRSQPIALKLGFASDEFSYSVELGQPAPSDSAFLLDPEIKRESIWAGPVHRPSAALYERRGPAVTSADGVVATGVATTDSIMTRCGDARATPEVLILRDRIRAWRFYDHLRTDADAPARQIRIGTRTPSLAHDGADLAAALQTIRELGDPRALDDAVADAFPGGRVEVRDEDGRFELLMQQHGLLRPLRAAELSDGTLRYLLWIAALLTPRPPELLVLNEPETSLHPDLLPPLARLVANAAGRSQIVVVSHAPPLVGALSALPACSHVVLEKVLGETRIVGQGTLDGPPWRWPAR